MFFALSLTVATAFAGSRRRERRLKRGGWRYCGIEAWIFMRRFVTWIMNVDSLPPYIKRINPFHAAAAVFMRRRFRLPPYNIFCPSQHVSTLGSTTDCPYERINPFHAAAVMDPTTHLFARCTVVRTPCRLDGNARPRSFVNCASPRIARSSPPSRATSRPSPRRPKEFDAERKFPPSDARARVRAGTT